MSQATNKTDIKELTHNRLSIWLEKQGVESYRAGQILKWVYVHQVSDFDEMTNLSKRTKDLLSSHFCINRLEKKQVETSRDGSKKFLFVLDDGKLIEAVLIPEKDHYTVCISTQAGCALGCRFCMTSRRGLERNLTRGEIVSQVRDTLKDLEPDSSMRLSNIVFMGMGEPLANYANVVSAIKTITDPEFGLRFSSRKITVSTAGIIPKINRLGQDTSVNLAISLNATDNETRSSLMPINKKYPVEMLLKACKAYKLKPRQRITFEYILIKGINDSPEDARRLSRLLRPIRSKINLIPFNEHRASDFKRPEASTIEKFKGILTANNYTAVVRESKGSDISAACGQLGARQTES